MGVTFTEPSNATRGQSFSISITFEEDTGGTIDDVSVSFDKQGDNITINTTSTGFTSSGVYNAGFRDVFTYVDAGESNKTQTPKQVININNLPPNKNMYDLDQDQRGSIDRIYNCTVTYTPSGNGASQTTEDVNVTHTVDNSLESIRSFMENYNYNNRS